MTGVDGAETDPTAGNNPGSAEPADQAKLQATPNDLAGTAGGQTGTGDLSFALKLDPQANPDTGRNDQNGAQTSHEQAASPVETPVKGAAELTAPAKETRPADPEPDAPVPAPRNDATAGLAVYQATEKSTPAGPEPAAQPHADAAKALQTSAVQSIGAEHASKPAGPLKDLSIQVGQIQSEKVELRVVERSGELQVAVRASNPDVAQGLRQGLPDLVDRLEQNGFRAEAWRPGAATPAIQGTAETRQRPMQFQQDQSQSQYQSGGQQQGRQQNRQNQSYRPQWVRELEGNLSGGTFGGEINGISR